MRFKPVAETYHSAYIAGVPQVSTASGCNFRHPASPTKARYFRRDRSAACRRFVKEVTRDFRNKARIGTAMLSTIFLAACSFILSFRLTPLLRDLALRRGWVDKPDNKRKVHP